EVITTHLEKLLASAQLTLSNIHILVTSIGPGSFTGIRVGINFVRAIAYARSLPIYTFDSLRVLADPFTDHKLPIVVMNNAHKNMIFTAVYQQDQEVLAPCALDLVQLEQTLSAEKYLCLGDAYEIYERHFSDRLKSKLNYEQPRSDFVAAQTLGQMWHKCGKKTGPQTWNQLLPLYIRASEAEEKLWSGLLRPPHKL
ncbi:MAG: tRNA (adenosine(37)-N6)-threonylcarbamoyltransferase complex dimerization subunit type 1 TsaB, partial [Bdellovibrionales bacterium]|nr:tRNA (adenosine(37)-N6)-threonylcarbamoyltransferase complex dimerization subunit type 1 TsaB [Bdellovibrionales bacterium]